MTAFKIREYQIEDINSVINILRLNTPKYFSAEEEKDLIHYLDYEIEYYYVIEVNSEITGCGGFNFDECVNKARISWDILHPDYQGKSLGSALLKFRIDKIKELDVAKNIFVRTSQLVYKFYEKNGFELLSIVKDYWADGYDLYEMKYMG